MLFVWYAALIVAGLGLSVLVMLGELTRLDAWPILGKAVVGSFGISALGSAVFYSRKLYKHSIRPDISAPVSAEEKIRQVGIFMYFFLRPLFGLCFAFLIVLFLKVSIAIVAVRDDTLNNGFIYLTMLLSFFAGFSAGDILAVLEQVGKRKMGSFFNSHD
jgi:hypothetical protein